MNYSIHLDIMEWMRLIKSISKFRDFRNIHYTIYYSLYTLEVQVIPFLKGVKKSVSLSVSNNVVDFKTVLNELNADKD